MNAFDCAITQAVTAKDPGMASVVCTCGANDAVNDAVAAECERCAKIAEYLAKGQALEIGGKTLLLGSMTTGECAAQEATATAIAAAIRYKETAR